MCDIKGQNSILTWIDTQTADSLPRSIAIYGEFGAGKHLLTKYISKKFNWEIVNLAGRLDQDTLNDIISEVTPKLYLIEADKLTIKDQSSILKFVEEPLKNAHIIITAEYPDSILPTIYNRCYPIVLKKYPADLLTSFVTDKSKVSLILKVATTPGQVISYQQLELDSIDKLAVKFIDKINLASYTNTLSISNRLAYKDEKDKYDPDVFIKLVLINLVEKIKQTSYNNDIKFIDKTKELIDKLQTKNVNKQYLIEKYLSEIWLLFHEV